MAVDTNIPYVAETAGFVTPYQMLKYKCVISPENATIKILFAEKFFLKIVPKKMGTKEAAARP